MKKKILEFPEVAKEVAQRLKEVYEKDGIFGEKSLPDDISESVKSELGEQFLNFLTLTTALDYVRDARKLWESAIKTAQDDTTRWVFVPLEVAKTKRDTLEDALSKYGIALRKEKDTLIWLTICKTLAEYYEGNVKHLFEKNDFDVEKVKKEIVERKELFPNISGEKMLPHWLRIVSEHSKVDLKNLETLPIPVDVHVARATLSTGCIRGVYKSKSISQSLRRKIMNVWSRGLENSEIIPVKCFRFLWLLSKHGCSKRNLTETPMKSECPVSDLCAEGKVKVSNREVLIETWKEEASLF